jgi:hypothetical protein
MSCIAFAVHPPVTPRAAASRHAAIALLLLLASQRSKNRYEVGGSLQVS